jgi:hypothetical protein
VPDRNRIETCSCCGQPVVPVEELHLSPIQRRIFDAVRRRPGISAENLRDVVWADDPNGGPECRHCIYVHVFQLNQRLAPLSILVRAPKGAGAGYRVIRREKEKDHEYTEAAAD